MVKLVIRVLLGLLVAFTIGKLFMAQNGILRQIELSQQNEEMQNGNDSLRTLISQLQQTKSRLVKDSFYIEETARTRFGMSRPGEQVYQFLGAQDSEPLNANTQPATSPGTKNQGVTVTRPD